MEELGSGASPSSLSFLFLPFFFFFFLSICSGMVLSHASVSYFRCLFHTFGDVICETVGPHCPPKTMSGRVEVCQTENIEAHARTHAGTHSWREGGREKEREWVTRCLGILTLR